MGVNEEGELRVAGRHEFLFTWASGSVQISEGLSINGTVEDLTVTHATLAAAGDKQIITASPEFKDSGTRNLRVKGVGTFWISW